MSKGRSLRLALVFACLALVVVPPAGSSSDTVTTGVAQDEAPTNYRFVVVADSRGRGSGVNEEGLSAVFSAIAELRPKPRFVFFVGDLIYGRVGLTEMRGEFDRWKNTIGMHYSPRRVFPVFGGHERTSATNVESVWKGFRNYFDPVSQLRRVMVCRYYHPKFNPADSGTDFSRTVYYCDYAGDRFFVLNNDCVPPGHSVTGGEADRNGCAPHELGCGQFSWLKKNLVANGKRHNFFFHHEPAFGSGAGEVRLGEPCPRRTLGYVMGTKKEPRNDYLRLLGFNGGTAIFSGHEHQYTWRSITNNFLNRPLNNPGEVEKSLALLIKAEPVGQEAGPAVAYSLEGAVAEGRRGRAPTLRLWWTSATGKPDRKVIIAAGRDDAEQFHKRRGEVYLDSSDLELMRDETLGEQRFIGLRWTDVRIPDGATIQRAQVYFTAKESSPSGPTVRVMGDASPYAFPFTHCRKDVQRRPYSSANVLWEIGEWRKNRRYATPDLAPIIQELLDEHGYGDKFPGQVPEIKTGSCGAPWYEGSCRRFMGRVQGKLIRLSDYRGAGMPFHYAVVDVGDGGIAVDVRSWDGTPLPVPAAYAGGN